MWTDRGRKDDGGPGEAPSWRNRFIYAMELCDDSRPIGILEHARSGEGQVGSLLDAA